MAMLPSPLIPDANQWIAARQAGYEQGEAQRRRNLLLEAGALAAASPAMSAPTVAPAAGGMSAYSNAISSIESGGRYDAIGPATRSGDRAYGKYQVMGANIPAWTRKHLGRELTPQQFLADKDAQEKVFAGEFGGYVQKYGNPQDAASMWFSGRPAAQGAGRNDGYTSQPEYLRRFNAALGGGGAPAPVQTVQARPLDPDAPLRNASNALLRGGELQAGLGLQNQLFERSEKARAQAEARRKEGEALFGELALRADTPEKWARAVEMARQGGLPVAGLEDFSAREFVIARAGKSPEFMAVGKRVFNKSDGSFVPDPASQGADNVSDGAGELEKGMRWRMRDGKLDLDASGRPIAEPIPGSPREAVTAEVAARIGLADKFKKDAPNLRADIQGGALGGMDFYLKRGKAGDILRRIEDGQEALVRNLTGAGMNLQEAESYAERFSPGRLDGTETILSKFDNLVKNLDAVQERVMIGRGVAGVDRTAPQTTDAPQIGAVEDGYRFKGGNPSDPKSWEPVH